MPHGQSHQTTLAQIAADEFGVPFEQVRVVVGDSDVVPFGLTGGSRSATMAGGVTLHGARQLKAKVLDVASLLIEASARRPARSPKARSRCAAIRQRHPGRRSRPAGCVQASCAKLSTLSLKVEATYDGGEGGWSGGRHCAIVEVDVETGLVHV